MLLPTTSGEHECELPFLLGPDSDQYRRLLLPSLSHPIFCAYFPGRPKKPLWTVQFLLEPSLGSNVEAQFPLL